MSFKFLGKKLKWHFKKIHCFKDSLNETQLLDSDELRRTTSFLNNYTKGSSSFRRAHDLSNKITNTINKNINVTL